MSVQDAAEIIAKLHDLKVFNEVMYMLFFHSVISLLKADAIQVLMRHLMNHKPSIGQKRFALDLLDYAHSRQLLGKLEHYFFDLLASPEVSKIVVSCKAF
jgi:hypothetical protein